MSSEKECKHWKHITKGVTHLWRLCYRLMITEQIARKTVLQQRNCCSEKRVESSLGTIAKGSLVLHS